MPTHLQNIQLLFLKDLSIIISFIFDCHLIELLIIKPIPIMLEVLYQFHFVLCRIVLSINKY
jgi:hypothetical protein